MVGQQMAGTISAGGKIKYRGQGATPRGCGISSPRPPAPGVKYSREEWLEKTNRRTGVQTGLSSDQDVFKLSLMKGHLQMPLCLRCYV